MNSIDFFVDLPRFSSPKCAVFINKNLFFPDGRNELAERLPRLVAICASCIHEKECKEYALEKQIPHGIWGGTTPAERNAQAIANGSKALFIGIALDIIRLHKSGASVNEIAGNLGTSLGYVRKVLKRLAATEQGADLLHQQIEDLYEGWL